MLSFLIQCLRNPQMRSPINRHRCQGLRYTSIVDRTRRCGRPIATHLRSRWSDGWTGMVYKCPCGRTTHMTKAYVLANRHGFATPDAYQRYLNSQKK